MGLCCEGTSAVDAALVSVRGRGERMKPRQLSHARHELPDELRRRLAEALAADALPVATVAALEDELAGASAEAAEALLRQSKCRREDVSAVGLVGPPLGAGRELGSPVSLAARLALTVAGRFAESDAAAGGFGGAAVTAWPAWRMLRDRRLSRALVHLGPAASLTLIGSDAAAGDVVAYDAGPGTALIDAVSRRVLDRPGDEDGHLAAGGTAEAALLNELLAAAYFRRPPPKATRPGDWQGAYLDRLLMAAERHGCEGRDILATATALVARAVADAIAAFTERPHEVILAGPGARNIQLASRIRRLMSPSSTYTAERYGLGLLAARAVFAAVLAAARVQGFAAHCPGAGGAGAPVVLGSLAVS